MTTEITHAPVKERHRRATAEQLGMSGDYVDKWISTGAFPPFIKSNGLTAPAVAQAIADTEARTLERAADVVIECGRDECSPCYVADAIRALKEKT